jgi:hypothetical protein
VSYEKLPNWGQPMHLAIEIWSRSPLRLDKRKGPCPVEPTPNARRFLASHSVHRDGNWTRTTATRSRRQPKCVRRRNDRVINGLQPSSPVVNPQVKPPIRHHRHNALLRRMRCIARPAALAEAFDPRTPTQSLKQSDQLRLSQDAWP